LSAASRARTGFGFFPRRPNQDDAARRLPFRAWNPRHPVRASCFAPDLRLVSFRILIGH
jgi:hypothetical protein